jgi:hypothetical protein
MKIPKIPKELKDILVEAERTPPDKKPFDFGPISENDENVSKETKDFLKVIDNLVTSVKMVNGVLVIK